MKAEQLTQALYDYCLISARVEGAPMGYRLPPWKELVARDPDDAMRWRDAAWAFLEGIGVDVTWDEEISFSAAMIKPLPAGQDAVEDDGEAHKITPDGG